MTNIPVMMKQLFTVLLLVYTVGGFGQKPVLDTAALSSWPRINDKAISNDGRYITYTVGPEGHSPVVYLQSTDKEYQKELGRGTNNAFTEDSKRMIYQKDGDSLCIVDLATKLPRYVAGVRSYKLLAEGEGRWLGYQFSDGALVLEDLFSGEKRSYGVVEDYCFSHTGKVLLLRGSDNGTGWLKWVDPAGGVAKTICRGGQIGQQVIDEAEGQVAFLVSDGEGMKAVYSLRLYGPGMDSAAVVAGEGTPGMERGYVAYNGDLVFSGDGEKLFFTLRAPMPPPPDRKPLTSVDIWNYRDEYLQCDQSANPAGHLDMQEAVYHVREGKVIRLQNERDAGFDIRKLHPGKDIPYLLTTSHYNYYEQYWQPSVRPSVYLVNTEDGSRVELSHRLFKGSDPAFSGDGRYVLWFDFLKGAYYCYNIRTGVTKNVSGKVPTRLTNELFDQAGPADQYGKLEWVQHDSVVLVYDRYDIWKLDPDGVRQPVNLTKGYGRKHHIVLRGVMWGQEPVVREDGGLLLCGLDEGSKENGFFRVNVHQGGTPEKLSMAPALYYFSGFSSSALDFPTELWKAKGSETYILTRRTATDYPNLVVTRDFKAFNKMTELAPEKKYNWLSSELVRWKTFAGHPAEGILYKPEDFDPRRKYPVIFHYYERKSDGLNSYYHAMVSTGIINIPWFVSRGYLVFCPDIHYPAGDPGAGIYDYVVSAAAMMRGRPCVDANRMGIEGTSFGGFETDYLVSHTTVFAAAASSAGISDLVSMSGMAGATICSGQGFMEYGQLRMGATLWQKKDVYLRTSAVFGADKVTTPLLLLNSNHDISAPWWQGVELFTALRRLRKPAWMLQYGGGHNLDGDDALDFTLRLTQFFDHYLKGAPQPRWMSAGIPARLKGIDDGLEMPAMPGSF